MANITYCTNACLTDRTPWQVLCQFKAKILSLLLILAILFHAAVVCISFEIRASLIRKQCYKPYTVCDTNFICVGAEITATSCSTLQLLLLVGAIQPKSTLH